MKVLTILLLALQLMLTGCESGGSDGADDSTDESTASTGTQASSETTYTSTRTTTGSTPPPSGAPYEGDTKTEDYTVADTEGNVIETGVRTYTYTEGQWVLTSDVGGDL